MAKNFTVSFNGKESVFGISTVERSVVYGKKRRIPLDSEGRACSRVTVTQDGSTMLRSGMTGQGYFLPDGSVVKQSQLETYDAAGKLLEKHPSSLSSSQALEGPVAPEKLLDTRISSVYLLDAVDLNDELKSALDKGDIFSLTFTLRDSYEPDIGYVLGNKNGYFLVSGIPAETEWMKLETTIALPVDDDVDADDIDFEML